MHSIPAPKFAFAKDGTRIAYTVHGNGPPLCFIRGWIGHLDLFWSNREFRIFFEQLGQHFTVYRIETRGNGLSARDVADLSWNALVSDVDAVVEQAGIEKSILWGTTFGATIAARYAVLRPNKVSRLVLDGTFVDGRQITSWLKRNFLILALRYFPEMGFTLLASATNPRQPSANYRRLEAVQQMISPLVAAKLYGLALRTNNRSQLSRVSCPTLVIHRSNSQSIPNRLGRIVAECIPDAEYFEVPGIAHNLWEENAPTARDKILSFAGIESAKFPVESNSPLQKPRRISAVMFADVVGYSKLLEKSEREGHRAVSKLLLEFEQLVEAFGGTVYTEAGDGVLSEFSTATAAARCALWFQKEQNSSPIMINDQSIQMRIGINLGEVIADRGSIFGDVVNIAARLQEAAKPNEVLVSQDVFNSLHAELELAAVSRGNLILKNIARPVNAYSISDNRRKSLQES